MRQIATGAEGAGYEVTFARVNPDTMPEGLAEMRKAVEAATDADEKARRVEAFQKVHAEWQREWEADPRSYAAYLLVDGRLVGTHSDGKGARSAAQKLEPTVASNISAAPLRWRTE